jgi:transcriptional regulator with XRE-family HTH domain
VPQKIPKSTDVHVGRRVRMRRLMLGMNQVKLGALLGVTFQQVQKYEKGANRIGASRLQQMAQVLRAPISFFFDGVPEMHDQEKAATTNEATTDYIADFLATVDGLAVCRAFMNINDPILRRRLVDLVEEIADAREQA